MVTRVVRTASCGTVELVVVCPFTCYRATIAGVGDDVAELDRLRAELDVE